jgi:superfamily I DNA and/or RNA helicase
LPLLPALFDLVIIDEASQCDIPSVIPLLARSRKAVLAGDPMQLKVRISDFSQPVAW